MRSLPFCASFVGIRSLGLRVKVRILLICNIVVACSLVAQTPPEIPTPEKEQCRITGVVVSLAGDQPLKKARIQLQSNEDQTRSIFAISDGSGRFELKGIEPGRYRLRASRHGFVVQEYGQRKPDDPGAVLTLRPSQELKDLVFRMIPSGVISGRILDEDGEALPSVIVDALRQVYSEGKRNLAIAGRVETNDLGEYRLFGLTPGRYFVSAVYPRSSRFVGEPDTESGEGHGEGYAKMYYPGTADAGKAASVTVKSGDEIPSVDILLRQVLVYRVRGRVYNQLTQRPGMGTNILLVPKTHGRQWEFMDQQVDVQKSDGSFEISDVLPGSYVLVAFWLGEGKFYTTRMPVEVGGADVDGLTVTIAPGATINGRVVWDGQRRLDKDSLSVALEYLDVDFGPAGRARVTQGDSFNLKGIGEGNYRVSVSGQSKDCYIKEVRYGESSVLKDGLKVGYGESPSLEITLSSRGARVEGIVTDEDGLPAAGVWVVLIPDTMQRTQYYLYRSQNTDQYGRFLLQGIAPGDYKLFSWKEVESDAWEDPDFLALFEGKGEEISLHEGDQKTKKLVVIDAKIENGNAAQP